MKKKLINKINKVSFFKKDFSFFSSYTDLVDNYLKVKTPATVSKYDLKLFLKDVYGIKCSSIHSTTFSSKKQKRKVNSSNYKTNWIKLKEE